MAKSLIITTSFGYKPTDLAPFINSARLNSPSSDLLFFCSAGDVEALRGLEKKHGQIILRPIPNPPVIIKGRARYIRLASRKFRRASLAAAQKIIRSNHEIGIETDSTLAKSTCQLHFLIRRFFWARQSLIDRSLADYDNIMLCDSRDVLIQSDPFCEINGHLTSGEEINHVGECSINRGWIKKAYGTSILSQLERSKIICAGVTLGSRDNILKYLNSFCTESLSLIDRHSTSYLPNLDQAIHNKILRLSKELNPFLTKPNGHISTVGCYQESAIAFDSNKKQVIIDGCKPAIIHQYDRSKSLSEFANTHYGSRR